MQASTDAASLPVGSHEFDECDSSVEKGQSSMTKGFPTEVIDLLIEQYLTDAYHEQLDHLNECTAASREDAQRVIEGLDYVMARTGKGSVTRMIQLTAAITNISGNALQAPSIFRDPDLDKAPRTYAGRVVMIAFVSHGSAEAVVKIIEQQYEQQEREVRRKKELHKPPVEVTKEKEQKAREELDAIMVAEAMLKEIEAVRRCGLLRSTRL